MPLVWAHAEYVKLLRSLRDGWVFDLPPQPVARYQQQQVASRFWTWRFNHKCRSMASGKILRIELPAPARVHWSMDGWQTIQEIETRDSRLGIHSADLPTCRLPAGTDIDFTLFWSGEERWEGMDFRVTTA
jgi:glucoamylase